MNNPNPLVPQGSLPQSSRGKSTVRLAVLTIVVIHAVFFAGLLMQGCKRDDANKAASAGKSVDLSSQSSELAKLDTNYYQQLPETPAPTNVPATAPSNPPAYQAVTPTPPVVSPPIVPETPAVTMPVETKEYTIVRNDTLARIAKAQHITIAEITKANPGLDPRKLIPGKKIQVPVSTHTAAAGGLGMTEPSKPDAGVGTKTGLYQVKAGETLTKIAKQHGVTVKALRVANGLKTDRLHVGQKLKIPASAGAATAVSELNPASAGGPISTLSATNPTGSTTVR